MHSDQWKHRRVLQPSLDFIDRRHPSCLQFDLIFAETFRTTIMTIDSLVWICLQMYIMKLLSCCQHFCFDSCILLGVACVQKDQLKGSSRSKVVRHLIQYVQNNNRKISNGEVKPQELISSWLTFVARSIDLKGFRTPSCVIAHRWEIQPRCSPFWTTYYSYFLQHEKSHVTSIHFTESVMVLNIRVRNEMKVHIRRFKRVIGSTWKEKGAAQWSSGGISSSALQTFEADYRSIRFELGSILPCVYTLGVASIIIPSLSEGCDPGRSGTTFRLVSLFLVLGFSRVTLLPSNSRCTLMQIRWRLNSHMLP